MSESVSAGAASATPSTSAPATGGGSPSQPQTTAPAEGSPSPAGNESTAEKQERILSEADLDAFVMQKINGKDEKVRLRDLQKAYGLDKAANQKMQEAARIQKQQQQLAELFNTDFQKFCELTGTDPDAFMRKNLSSRKELAEEILAAEYERQQLSPAEREALEYKERIEAYERRDRETRQPIIDQIKQILPESMLPKGLDEATPEQLQQFLKVKQQEHQQGIDNISNELLGAWEKNGLPKQKEMGQWMAQVMLEHEKRTGESLHPDQAAAKVKARFLKSTQTMFSQMDAKAIHETLGDAVIEKLRAYDIEQVRSSSPQFSSKETSPGPAPASEPKKHMNQLEWRKAMGIG